MVYVDKVNNIGGRADCQDDFATFNIMRRSFLEAFGTDTLALYAADLKQALEEGRNLITEKYAYMMEFTNKEYFDEALKSQLPGISPEKEELVGKIAESFTQCEKAFAQKHPVFSASEGLFPEPAETWSPRRYPYGRAEDLFQGNPRFPVAGLP